MKKLIETTDTAKIATLPNWKADFPGLHRQVTRHGKEVWYVRTGTSNRGERIRIRAPYGTEDFRREYDNAMHGVKKPAPDLLVADTKTLAWLITEYRKSADWLAYGHETRYGREYYLQKAQTKSGHEHYRKITKKSVIASRDSLKGAAARHFVDAMRGLFKWAEANEHVVADPTAGVTYPKRKRGAGTGFRTWTEAEIATYERKYPIGTRERVWLAVLQFLGGPRRGDAAVLGRQHVRRGPAGLEVVFKTEKSGRTTEVTIPMLPEFMEVIAAGPIGETTFICGARGRPLRKQTFGDYFRIACDNAGLYGLTAHGVRKAMATRMADRGASENALMAVFGWTDPRMPSVYTRAANKKGLSRANVALLGPVSDASGDPLTINLDDEIRKEQKKIPSP